MKTFRLLAVSLFVTAIFSVAALAQTSPIKIGVMDTRFFEDEKLGITKYVGALNVLDAEFKPKITELEALGTRLQNLTKEGQQMADAYQKNPNGPIGPQQIQAKADEVEKVKLEGQRKQEDLKASYERRRQQIVGPIFQDIGKVLQEFAKAKGYTMIFDLAKDEQGFLLAVGDEKIDVTKDFITFYNTKPATTAATTTPKPTTPKP